MGDVVAAVDRYKDIPAPVRAKLKQRMQARQYDEFVTIRRDSIDGSRGYEPRISQMHFGNGQICEEIDRSRWTPQMTERGLVYCEGEHCVLVPTVCRNVSRIALRPQGVAPATVAQAPPPLEFEPPGAGGSGETFQQVVDPPPPPVPPGTPPGNPPPPLWPPPPPPPPPFVPPPTTPPPPVAVPEPGTWALWFAGLAGLGVFVRSRRARQRAGLARCATQKRS